MGADDADRVEADFEADFEADYDATDDEELRASLDELSRIATGRLDLESSLIEVATLVVRAIPGADGAGLTLLETDRSDTIVATAEFVSAVDAIQYGIRQGPCISAAEEGVTMRSGSLGGDPRWPRFGAQVARLGVHSVISLPLPTAEGVVGAMNVYAHAKNAFGARAAQIGELFAVPAAIAVQNALVLAQTKRLAAQLGAALDDRRQVDRAVGIVMSRTGATEDQALDRLRAMSQQEQRKLPAVAESVVDEAVRRARARRLPPTDEG